MAKKAAAKDSAASTPVAILLDIHRNPIQTVPLTSAPTFYLTLPEDNSVWYHVDDDSKTGAWRYMRVK